MASLSAIELSSVSRYAGSRVLSSRTGLYHSLDLLQRLLLLWIPLKTAFQMTPLMGQSRIFKYR